LLGLEQPARRTADAIGLRACFRAIDCNGATRSWGWNRSTTSRRIKAWVASGRLVRTPGPDGRSVFTARTPDVPQACNAAAGLASPLAKSLIIPTVPACAIRCTGRTPRSPDRVILRIDRANDACEVTLVRELAAVRHPLLQKPSRARREVGRDQPPPGLGACHWPSVPQRRIARFLAVHVSPNR
jgi:hypothetical protein